MANGFGGLRQALLGKISSDREKKNRLSDPEFKERLRLLRQRLETGEIKQEAALKNLSGIKKKEQASKLVTEQLTQLASIPIENFDLTEQEQEIRQEIERLGGPAALQEHDNKLKFSKTVLGGKNPELMDALSTLDPEFGLKFSGLTRKQEAFDVVGRSKLAKTKSAGDIAKEQAKGAVDVEVEGVKHKNKMEQIAAKAASNLDVATKKLGQEVAAGKIVDPKLKLAAQILTQLSNIETFESGVRDIDQTQKDMSALNEYIVKFGTEDQIPFPQLRSKELQSADPNSQLTEDELSIFNPSGGFK